MSETKRQLKYARLIHKEIGDIFLREGKVLLGGSFVTVIGVNVSPDLGVAKIHLSMMLVEDKEQMMENLNHRKRELRKMLGNRIGKHVRSVPEIILYLDEVGENASRLDKLIDSLEIPPAEEEE